MYVWIYPKNGIAEWITIPHHFASWFTFGTILEFYCSVETVSKQLMVRFVRWLPYRSCIRYKSVIVFTNLSIVVSNLSFGFPIRSLLGDSQRHLFDCYKRLYAEMLFRWNLLVPRAKVLKYLSVNTEIHRDVEYVTECTSCARVTKAPLCKECRKPLLKCVLCRLPVKGLANACLNCGHGGHSIHMKIWFSVKKKLSSLVLFWTQELVF